MAATSWWWSTASAQAAQRPGERRVGTALFRGQRGRAQPAEQRRECAKPTLSQLLASLSQVVRRCSARSSRRCAPPGAASASLAELSHPANCYFVTLRPDAVAAIRIAHERMNVELASAALAGG